MKHMKIQEIPTGLLLEHPENSNFMNAETAQKLRRHIERTGRYEPLTVRPHPFEEGKFQVINGHNRLRVLRALNYQIAHCVVWDLDDDQTRLYLATLNRLSGSDIPERRAVLLENLLDTYPGSSPAAEEAGVFLASLRALIETPDKLLDAITLPVESPPSNDNTPSGLARRAIAGHIIRLSKGY